MEKAITEKVLAIQNLSRKPFRTATLVTIVALSSAVLFASLLIVSSLKGGIFGIQSRIGADLMVVPEGYESKMENVLLSGEPNYFYMDKSVEDEIRKIEGVAEVSAQFYLTSLTESCCDFPVQIVGFDPKSDFIIKNWAKSRFTESDEMIFAGSNVNLEKNTVRFFEGTHNVTSKLAKTGSGMDNAIYADLSTLQKIFEDAKSKGFGFISDGDTRTKTSVIFVKLKEGAGADAVSLRIRNAAKGINVIQGGKFMSNLVDRLSSFMIFLHAISFIVLLISVLTLSAVFCLTLNERRREFSILRVLGAERNTLRKIIFSEALILGIIGSATGIFLSALAVLPFNILIAEKISLPFALSSPSQIALFALAVFSVSVLACMISSLSAVVRIAKAEPYGDVK
ncbi:MAG: ABC transporter permease [Treponema sp.]|nr:ABC transporter permease [Treponema sp.]MBR4630495.1 ABC transporter permease [Treponema sp.]